jgi:hypothetical protein
MSHPRLLTISYHYKKKIRNRENSRIGLDCGLKLLSFWGGLHAGDRKGEKKGGEQIGKTRDLPKNRPKQRSGLCILFCQWGYWINAAPVNWILILTFYFSVHFLFSLCCFSLASSAFLINFCPFSALSHPYQEEPKNNKLKDYLASAFCLTPKNKVKPSGKKYLSRPGFFILKRRHSEFFKIPH